MGNKIKKLSDINIGDFVKYSDVDQKGKYSYVGQVKVKDDINTMFWMVTYIGDLGFCLKKSYDLELTDEIPVGWDKYIKDPEQYRMNKSLKTAQKREAEEKKNKEQLTNFKTQKQIINELVIDNIKKDDKKIMKLIKESGIQLNDSDILKQITLIRIKQKK